MTNTSKAKSDAEGPRLQVTFLKSAPTLADCPPADPPEIAFAGRSNAGKSSVLNRLTGSRLTAKVSKTPGRTQVLNLFDVRDGGRLVDLPGYGYAKASKSAQAAWQRNVNEYLSERESLVGVVLVMDIRHPLTDYDLELAAWAHQSELPLLILLNKADKLKQGQRQKTLSEVRKALQDQALTHVQLFSSQTGLGSAQLVAQISELLQQSLQAESTPQP